MRTDQIVIRLDKKEKSLLEVEALKAGKPLSSWARSTLLERAKLKIKGDRFIKRPPTKKKPGDSPGGELVSFFCGPGGLDLGFSYAGFETALAIDIDKECVNTFNENHKGGVAYARDLRELSLESLDELAGKELNPVGVIGGPPCQSFSYSNVHQKDDDPRHALPMVYANLLRQLNRRTPISFFVFENVMGLLGEKHIDKYKKFKDSFQRAGFKLFEQRLNALNYGVPQDRPRLFIVGINKNLHPKAEWVPPEPLNTIGTVRDAIYGLDEPEYNSPRLDPTMIPVHPNHICMVPRSKKFTEGLMKPGTVKGRCFRVLSWDQPSWTVAYGNREVHVHPKGHRRLSMYEAMKLQTFPDWYRLTGNLTAQVRLVSEAVPPNLACHIADSVRASLGI